MHFEFLVEEESAEVALKNLLPKILDPSVTYDFHTFQGKQDLLKKLPQRLRGYRHWPTNDWRIMVLIDNDEGNCLELKNKLESIADQENLITLSRAGCDNHFHVVNRLAIQELEAWFFGDINAIRTAYPNIPKTLDKKKQYRHPDAINNTWEALERVLQRAGYYPGGLLKIKAAREISQYMNPQRNTSKSFQVFRDSIQHIGL